ncbi:KfrB domain-containing protein, partial [Thiolapillus sp.]|uniref:KfrB domain-containing protein n=1 Tax=Thiolapillus sp. TaxID=2017437 RepID=UPI003AF80C61
MAECLLTQSARCLLINQSLPLSLVTSPAHIVLPSVNVETGYGTRFTERRTVWFDRLRYDGPIVAADGWYAIQRVASQTFVAHSVQALDDSPQVGAV